MDRISNTEQIESEETVLYLGANDQKTKKALNVEMPVWESIGPAIDRAFQFGGFVSLNVKDKGSEIIGVKHPKPGLVSRLNMRAQPHEYVLSCFIFDENNNAWSKLFFWWEPGDRPFREKRRLLEDLTDDRMICVDVEVAKTYFRDMYENGNLSPGNLALMRSPRNPKP